MTREDLDFIGALNMHDEISNEAYKKIVCHFEGQEPCNDAISRQAVLAKIDEERKYLLELKMNGAEHIVVHHARRIIEDMPSVKQEPKTGHWITHKSGRWIYAKCSECGTIHDTRTNYCPNCGCRMKGEADK